MAPATVYQNNLEVNKYINKQYKVWVLYYLLQIMMISQTGLDASSSLRKIKGKKIGQIAAVHPRPSTQVGNTAPPLYSDRCSTDASVFIIWPFHHIMDLCLHHTTVWTVKSVKQPKKVFIKIMTRKAAEVS